MQSDMRSRESKGCIPVSLQGPEAPRNVLVPYHCSGSTSVGAHPRFYVNNATLSTLFMTTNALVDFDPRPVCPAFTFARTESEHALKGKEQGCILHQCLR